MDASLVITHYWPQILAAVSVIVAFVNIKWQNNNQEKRLMKLEDTTIPDIYEKMDSYNPIFTAIQTQLADINAKLALLLKDKHLS